MSFTHVTTVDDEYVDLGSGKTNRHVYTPVQQFSVSFHGLNREKNVLAVLPPSPRHFLTTSITVIYVLLNGLSESLACARGGVEAIGRWRSRSPRTAAP